MWFRRRQNRTVFCWQERRLQDLHGLLHKLPQVATAPITPLWPCMLCPCIPQNNLPTSHFRQPAPWITRIPTWSQLFCAVPAFMLYMYSTVYSLIRVFVMTSNWLRHTWSAIGVNMLLFSSFLATSYNFSANFCAFIATHKRGLFVSNSQTQ